MDEDIDPSLKGTFIVGDKVYYEVVADALIIKKREQRKNFLFRTKADGSRY